MGFAERLRVEGGDGLANGDYRRSWDQEAGRRFGPWGSWTKARERQARHRVRRLKAVANMVHSAATLVRPRSRNLRAPCCSLMIPKTGSTSCFLSLYACLAAEVAIQARWRRNAASCGPMARLRPISLALVQTLKAGHA